MDLNSSYDAEGWPWTFLKPLVVQCDFWLPHHAFFDQHHSKEILQVVWVQVGGWFEDHRHKPSLKHLLMLQNHGCLKSAYDILATKVALKVWSRVFFLTMMIYQNATRAWSSSSSATKESRIFIWNCCPNILCAFWCSASLYSSRFSADIARLWDISLIAAQSSSRALALLSTSNSADWRLSLAFSAAISTEAW